MDGDMRPRWRHQFAPPVPGQSWGYSATLPADVTAPLTAPPHAEAYAPRREAPQRDRGDVKPDKDGKDVEKAGKDDGKDQKTDDADRKKDAPKKPPTPGWKKALYALIGLLVLGGLITVGVLYYLHARHFENTDDAFIDGHQSQVSAQVAARVIRLAVSDNELVTAGQVLVDLDPRDYQVKLDQANAQRAQAAAQLIQAGAQLAQQQANLDQAIAQVHVAEADLGQQQADLNRYRAIDPKAITRQQLDTSGAQTRSAAARLDANKQAVAGARANVDAQKAMVDAAAANLAVADVAVANAELQLSYTHVLAPTTGRVTKRSVEVGNYLNVGQALLAIVPDDLWITANFKETQLADMRKGQRVAVTIDACPGAKIDAIVDSFQSGTGAVFSALPAENATGNYVKVVQRVPVKLTFTNKIENCNLALGMSVSPQVTVR